MKLRFALFALLLGAVSLHAVTVDWTIKHPINSNAAGIYESHTETGLKVNDSSTFALAATFGQSLGTGVIFAAGARSTGTDKALRNFNRFTVTVNEGGTLTLTIAGSSLTDTATKTTDTAVVSAGLQTTIGLALARDGSHSTSATLYVGGVEVATLTKIISGGPINTFAWGSNFDAEGSAYSGDMTYATAALYDPQDTGNQSAGLLSGDQIATLPEPTALALLALGVAGLALKRRSR